MYACQHVCNVCNVCNVDVCMWRVYVFVRLVDVNVNVNVKCMCVKHVCNVCAHACMYIVCM